ncbi:PLASMODESMATA CALLOSE-BINDING PROTEIN 3-like [Zingiber officinale]|uniref:PLASMODESMATA CALLOSE-BINDING PROTEIN 3-like n=1 Tax=Zingiber officinale TaxID=94328 RepID=UPI001C4C7D95|nr:PLASMODESMATA CALLOSE-BINDING PROTEIN 3-like [Zingiber officinale]
MAAFLLLLLIPLSSLSPSDAAWCVCRSDMSTTALQKTLDFACGAGADCTPILQNGACYNPNTVLAHCSYAANSYYQRKGQAQDACDFSGTAVLSSTDPGVAGGNGCSYTATPSALGSSTTPTTPEGASSMPTNSSSFTPSTTTGTGGVFGVVPTGTGNFDASDAALLPNKMLIMPSLLFMFTALFASLENFI